MNSNANKMRMVCVRYDCVWVADWVSDDPYYRIELKFICCNCMHGRPTDLYTRCDPIPISKFEIAYFAAGTRRP